ncbi:MAG: flagellar assembly peptidoglycan hydrolase FlgJ [Gammaproteobacteria bacterium]
MTTTPAATAFVYTDPQALSQIKRDARNDSPAARRDVAAQFEALFMQMMLKSMRSASAGIGGALDSEQSLFYRDLSDQQLALTLAKGGQLGFGRLLEQQLGGASGHRKPIEPGQSLTLSPGAARRAAPIATDKPDARIAPEPPNAATPLARGSGKPPASPEEFVQRVWTHAQQAANRLGQKPEVLIAQAALETGWGKSVPRSAQGTSHNLFGIKADSRWNGPKVVNSTIEYAGGVAERRRDGFRAYDSYAESFNDYVSFLQNNPRYRTALGMRGDSSGYLRAMHRAGYATDPSYAAKVEAILNGPELKRALERLKLAETEPITPSKG